MQRAAFYMKKLGGYVYMHPSGERVPLAKWLHDKYLTEIYGVYTPRLGGWS